jgi:hypothetical protein
MSRESIIDSQFTDGFNEANALWEQDRLEECIVKAHELLAEQAIPRYHRMKTLLLLASTVGDWYEANSYRVEAEALWQIVRRWHPEGEDENIDGHMAEIRGILEDADRMLQEEEPKDYDLDDEVQHMVRNHDEEVADAQAMMQDMDLDGHKNAKAATTEMKTTDMEHSEHVPAARKVRRPDSRHLWTLADILSTVGPTPPRSVSGEDGRQTRSGSPTSV